MRFLKYDYETKSEGINLAERVNLCNSLNKLNSTDDDTLENEASKDITQ